MSEGGTGENTLSESEVRNVIEATFANADGGSFNMMELARDLTESRDLAHKGLRAIAELAPRYPGQTGQLLDYILQQAHVIDPKVLISEISDMLWRPDIDARFKARIYPAMNYVYSFYGPAIEEKLIEELDFTNPGNYFRTGT